MVYIYCILCDGYIVREGNTYGGKWRSRLSKLPMSFNRYGRLVWLVFAENMNCALENELHFKKHQDVFNCFLFQ